MCGALCHGKTPYRAQSCKGAPPIGAAGVYTHKKIFFSISKTVHYASASGVRSPKDFLSFEAQRVCVQFCVKYIVQGLAVSEKLQIFVSLL